MEPVVAALELALVDAAAAVELVVEVLFEDVLPLLLELVLDVELPNSDCSSCMSPQEEFELEDPEFGMTMVMVTAADTAAIAATLNIFCCLGESLLRSREVSAL